jgi:Rab GDP dissociation inhibitor
MFSKAKGVIHKVPATAKEAVSSDLMGLFEKNRCRKFFEFCQDYDLEKRAKTKDFDPNDNFSSVIKKFGLETNTTDFIGHAVALYTNDDFLEKPSYDTLCKIKLYMNSIGRYGNKLINLIIKSKGDSPFIYPVWGLSGLAEGFSRLCALHQGVYMLNRDVEKILFDEQGKFIGVESQGEVT